MTSSGGPLVSVLISTYNCGEYVCAAVESALAQTHRAIEVIVLDDGSTDDTRVRLRGYEGRIRYMYQPNRGLAASRNATIAAARGEAVALLDADDYCAPRRVEQQLRLLNSDPNIGFVVCRPAVMRLDGTITGEEYTRHAGFAENEEAVIRKEAALPRYIRAPFFLTTTALLRKSVLNSVGGYDEALRVCEDLDMTLRLLQVCDMGYVNKTLYYYRRGRPESLSATRLKTCAANIEILERFAESQDSRAPEVRRALAKRLAQVHALRAAFLIQEGNPRGAREHLARAAQWHPSAKTWARLALAKTGSPGRAILSWMVRRKFRREPCGNGATPGRGS
jgi:glycosyltransferase involved in cell wall biosynthesis